MPSSENQFLTRTAVIFAGALGAAYWLILLYLNYPTSNLDFLHLGPSDDLAFYRVVLRMYDSIWPFDLRNFFNISFQTYGFLYFFINLLVAAPAFAVEAWDSAALILRMGPATWAVATLLLSTVLVARVSTSPAAPFLAAPLLLSMPAYWSNALWNHPDHMMIFFVVAAFYAMTFSETLSSRKHTMIVAVLFAMSVASKFQGVLASLGLAIALSYHNLFTGEATLQQRLQIIARQWIWFGVTAFAAYILLDPYLLHPLGWWALWDDIQRNLVSNATNHGAYTIPTVWQKIDLLARYYFNPIAAVLLIAAIGLCVRWSTFEVTQRQFIAGAAISAVTIFAIVFPINKAWEAYYLESFVLLAILIPILLPAPNLHKWRHRFGVLLVALAAATTLATGGTATIRISNYAALNEMKIAESAADLQRLLSAVYSKGDSIAASPRTHIPFRALGLSPRDVAIIDGPRIAETVPGKTVIVLRRNDIYFDESLYADLDRRRLEDRTALLNARAFVRSLLDGTNSNFGKCREDENYYIFCQK